MKCQVCKGRAHVRLIEADTVVCWDCYNAAIKASTTKVQAKTLRKSY